MFGSLATLAAQLIRHFVFGFNWLNRRTQACDKFSRRIQCKSAFYFVHLSLPLSVSVSPPLPQLLELQQLRRDTGKERGRGQLSIVYGAEKYGLCLAIRATDLFPLSLNRFVCPIKLYFISAKRGFCNFNLHKVHKHTHRGRGERDGREGGKEQQ